MMLSKRTYRWFYDHLGGRWYDMMIKYLFLPFGGEQKIREQLLEPITFCPTDTILDMCCGTGSATFAIASKAGARATIVGLDLSGGQLRRAKAKNRFANVRFVQGDATSTSFDDGCFDKVLITHAIHEMQRNDRLLTLAEARRVLKHDGTLAVLEVDNPNSLLMRVFVGFWAFYWLPFNFETPTRRDMFRRGLVNEVKEAGFEDVKKTSFMRGVLQVVEGKKASPSAVPSAGEGQSVVPDKPEHIRVTDVDGQAVVCFNNLDEAVSDWTIEGIERIREELNALADQRQWASIILDFESEVFIPYAAFEGVLAKLHVKLAGKLRLCNLPPMVMEHFRINRLADLFHIYPTREDALKATR